MGILDSHCPFCDTYGSVEFYESATSLYSELVRCRFCHEVFDEYDRIRQERREKERILKRRQEREKIVLPREKKVKQKKHFKFRFKVVILMTVSLIVLIFR